MEHFNYSDLNLFWVAKILRIRDIMTLFNSNMNPPILKIDLKLDFILLF